MATWRIQRIPWALSGVLFVALFGVGFVFANVLSSAPYPNPFDTTSAEVERYFTDNHTLVRGMSFSYSVAAIALLAFAAYVAMFVRRAADEIRSLSELALGGGMLAAAFLLLSALALWLLTRPTADDERGLIRALHDLAYIAGGPAHVISFAPFVGASSIAALKTRTLPRWIAWLGLGASALSLLSITALLWERAAYILPLARVLSFAWIFFVSLVLAAFWPRVADSSQQTSRPVGGHQRL
jgi:hypothetical protein